MFFRFWQVPTRFLSTTKVRSLIHVLRLVEAHPALYLNASVIRDAIRRYEHLWIPLLAKLPPASRTKLVPPLDVEWVWFVHMLCPTKYLVDSAAMWQAVQPKDTHYIIDHELLSPTDRVDGIAKAKEAWGKHCTQEPYDVLEAVGSSPLRDDCDIQASLPASRITFDIVAAAERQMAFYYQVAVMPQYQADEWLKYAVHRYAVMFLKLQGSYRKEMWVPAFDIDIAWHTHMMHPRRYKKDTERLTGRLLPHDDTFNDRTPGSDYISRWDATRATWMKMFGAPVERPGGMWRGNVSPEELELRPKIKRAIQTFERSIAHQQSYQLLVTDSEPVLSKRDSHAWAKVPWVHMTAWRNEIRNRTDNCDSMHDPMGYESFLCVGQDGSNVLATGRAVYAPLLNNQRTCGYRNFLEVYSGACNNDEPRYPLATAHPTLPGTVHSSRHVDKYVCQQLPGEVILVLRVGGEDFALLGGVWEKFMKPVEGIVGTVGKRRRRDDIVRSDVSASPGQLSLRLWFLGRDTPDEWFYLSREGTAPIPHRYKFNFPSRTGNVEDSLEEQISFNLAESTVGFNKRADGLAASLIAMASAQLHVMLQPRIAPNEGDEEASMYPSWTTAQKDYAILRGLGGERFVDGKREGFAQHLLRNGMPNDKGFYFARGGTADGDFALAYDGSGAVEGECDEGERDGGGRFGLWRGRQSRLGRLPHPVAANG